VTPQALRLSEDAACNRIDAARTCRRFPVILDLLASGEVTLTTVRPLGRHLTPENREAGPHAGEGQEQEARRYNEAEAQRGYPFWNG
jgi:hypothetical protein